MFELILYEPEIPPNTGNIIRLCANTGSRLHLIHPLGFEITHKQLRRAGLDYREFVDLIEHETLADCLKTLNTPRLLPVSTRGQILYTQHVFQPGDAILFGPETRGLPVDVLESVPADQRLRIPMRPGNRSLNLANAAAVVLYEAWRQSGFD
jgi:tRNA (cytidine/uridine-2'-O-)-methyltransferase